VRTASVLYTKVMTLIYGKRASTVPLLTGWRRLVTTLANVDSINHGRTANVGMLSREQKWALGAAVWAAGAVSADIRIKNNYPFYTCLARA
jgi:NADH:ubiquinone oxidoreductase subunit D